MFYPTKKIFFQFVSTFLRCWLYYLYNSFECFLFVLTVELYNAVMDGNVFDIFYCGNSVDTQ